MRATDHETAAGHRREMSGEWYSEVRVCAEKCEKVRLWVRKSCHFGAGAFIHLVGRGREPYEITLFYTYAPVQGYARFIEDIKDLCPLHCSRIKDYLVTFHKEEECPCGYKAP